jgi:hypothetical protein
VELYIEHSIKSYPNISRSRVAAIPLFFLSEDNIEINDISFFLDINEVIGKQDKI